MVDEQQASQLPKPAGYKILCAIPDIEAKFDSGLLKAEKTVKDEEFMTTVLFVVSLGPGLLIYFLKHLQYFTSFFQIHTRHPICIGVIINIMVILIRTNNL